MWNESVPEGAEPLERFWLRLTISCISLTFLGLGLIPYVLTTPAAGRRTTLLVLAGSLVLGVFVAVLIFGPHRIRDAARRRRHYFIVGMVLAPILIAGIIVDGGVGSPITCALLPPALLTAAAFPPRDALWHLVPISIGYLVAWTFGDPVPLWVVGMALGLFLSTVVPVMVVRGATLRYTVDQEQRAASLEKISAIDGLTGCRNHRSFHDLLGVEVERAESSGTPFSLLLLDVDHFKQVNDTHGHAAGDKVLATIGRILREHARRNDVVGRLGGEEFAVLLRGADVEAATAVAERIRCAVAAVKVGEAEVTISCGVGQWRRGTSAAQLRREVDELLYEAKAAGRDLVVSQQL